MSKKIFVVGGANWYANWISDSVLTNDINEADIVLFTGGEDVDPVIYGKEKHHTTYSNIARDEEEADIFNEIREDQLALGICRGLRR